MPRQSRLEPAALIAIFSPTTVVLVAASVALASLAGLPWWGAAATGFAVWFLKLQASRLLSKRLRARPVAVDPFALREPWRLLVKGSLKAQHKFARTVDRVDEGPLRERLDEIGRRIDQGVQESWEVAQRGQHLTDARRSIDIGSADRVRSNKSSHAAQIEAASYELAAHQRLSDRESDVITRLQVLNARLNEAVTRATEMATRRTTISDTATVSDAIDGVIGELKSLKLGLDTVDGIQ